MKIEVHQRNNTEVMSGDNKFPEIERMNNKTVDY